MTLPWSFKTLKCFHYNVFLTKTLALLLPPLTRNSKVIIATIYSTLIMCQAVSGSLQTTNSFFAMPNIIQIYWWETCPVISVKARTEAQQVLLAPLLFCMQIGSCHLPQISPPSSVFWCQLVDICFQEVFWVKALIAWQEETKTDTLIKPQEFLGL